MKKVVVLLTTCLLLIGASLSIAAETVAPVAALSTDALDFRYYDDRDKPQGKATVSMGDVLDSLEGVTVSAAEKNYISLHFHEGSTVLRYTNPMPVDRNCDYDGVRKCLTVTVMQDSYEATKHDTIVYWIPTTAAVGDSTAAFVPAPDLGEGYYRAVLEDVEWSADMTAMVEYCAEFKVAAETLNEYINFAYEQSLLLHDEYSTLDDRIASYQAALQAYERNRAEWEKYESDSEQYALYEAKVAKYQDYLEYQAYLVRLAAYRENKQLWDGYDQNVAKYQEYLNYKNNTYPELLAQYQTMQHQLALLALLEKQDPNTGMSFIEMMTDGRIDNLINDRENQTLLRWAVGDGTVDNAIKSNAALKKFCTTYQSLTTDREKYEFYIKNNKSRTENGVLIPGDFVKNLTLLYDSIQIIYSNEWVYDRLKADYPHHITTLVRMLGSLYVQRCVFDDDVTLKLNEIVDVHGRQMAGTLVHSSVRPVSDTNNATPLSAWMQEPVDPETYEVTKMPQEPSEERQDEPQKPTFTTVSHEGELDDYMEEPSYMAKPQAPEGERLTHPGQEPALQWTEAEQNLHDAFLAGDVVRRTPFTQDQTVSVYATNQFTIQLDDSERRYYVYFYTDDHTYLDRSLGVAYGETAKLPAGLTAPEKPSSTQQDYKFAGWVDEDGEQLDMTNMTADINAYASYDPVPRKYTVTWKVGSGDVVQQWEYGQVPVFEGSIDKPQDERYTYEFVRWDKQITAVTGDVTYTAQYERQDRRYSVTFDMGDGTAPIVKEYRYGQSLADVVSALSKPYLAPTAEFSYTFKGWNGSDGQFYAKNEDFPILTEDMTFTADFDQTRNTYTVTWIVEGVATETTWEYGTLPSFGQDKPSKETDERNHYKFADWDQEIVTVTGDATYTAIFDPTPRLYLITFVVEGETYTLELEYDQMPVFEGELQKQSDVQYDYDFAGWDNILEPVRGDVTYVAQFGASLRKYPVKFVVGEEEHTVEVEYGKTPKYAGGTPEKPDDDTYRYRFIGWDKQLVAVDGSAVTYTACFEAVPFASDASGQHGKLDVREDGVFELELSGTQADISRIFEKAGEEQASALEVLFGEAVLVFPQAQIEAFYLMGSGIASVSLVQTEQDGKITYKLEMLDESGEPVTYLVTELTLKLPYSGTNIADVFLTEADGTLTKLEAEQKDGYLTFTTMDSASFVVKEKFTIGKNAAENGVLDAPGEAYAGDVIVITPDPNEGYHVDEVLVEYGGQTLKLEMTDGKYSFVMPGDNVLITTSFKAVEGGTVSEVIIGIVTALLIVAIGFVIAIVVIRKKNVKV